MSTVINAEIFGMKPFAKHGFAVHESGDLSNGCDGLGPHYNPFGVNHGSPNDDVRHVGALGNVEANEFGKSIYRAKNELVSLWDDTSIIGRGCVLHANEDDLGQGGDEGSLENGNSGAAIACGVIELWP